MQTPAHKEGKQMAAKNSKRNSKVTVAQLAKQGKTSPRRIRRIARNVIGTGSRGSQRTFTSRQADKVLAAL